MPVEIHELIIRAVVDPGSASDDREAALTEAQLEELVQTCVSESLRILRREKER